MFVLGQIQKYRFPFQILFKQCQVDLLTTHWVWKFINGQHGTALDNILFSRRWKPKVGASGIGKISMNGTIFCAAPRLFLHYRWNYHLWNPFPKCCFCPQWTNLCCVKYSWGSTFLRGISERSQSPKTDFISPLSCQENFHPPWSDPTEFTAGVTDPTRQRVYCPGAS